MVYNDRTYTEVQKIMMEHREMFDGKEGMKIECEIEFDGYKREFSKVDLRVYWDPSNRDNSQMMFCYRGEEWQLVTGRDVYIWRLREDLSIGDFLEMVIEMDEEGGPKIDKKRLSLVSGLNILGLRSG